MRPSLFVRFMPWLGAVLLFLMNAGSGILNAYAAWHGNFTVSHRDMAMVLIGNMLLWAMAIIISSSMDPIRVRHLKSGLMMGSIGSLFLAFYADVLFLFCLSLQQNDADYFVRLLPTYVSQEGLFYGAVLGLTIAGVWIINILHGSSKKGLSQEKADLFFLIGIVILSVLVIYPLPLLNRHLGTLLGAPLSTALPYPLMLVINGVYGVSSLCLLGMAYYHRDKRQQSLSGLLRLINAVGITSLLNIGGQMTLFIMLPTILHKQGLSVVTQPILNTTEIINYLPLIFLVGITALCRKIIKKKQFDDRAGEKETSGHFGTAQWATPENLAMLNAYEKKDQIFIGVDDEGKSLYLPLWNKLTISPPGGGKTTTSSIPVLLSHEGPAFVFDVKGELWAVTARYRAEVLKREVVVIDPFGITRSVDFAQGKSEALLKEHRINPFDWIPSDRLKRDRMLNAFAASFIVEHGENTANHFDENAKILIRGYIDYLMSSETEERSFSGLYHLMSESIQEAEITFEEMAKLDGRAAAAANQISRVGTDERGSILSTSYRQIDWMGDSNIQEALSESTFDLMDFLKGNMDIYVILPTDQIKEHARLVRMLLAVLMGLIVQANPRDLPQKKMLFLLEELAQLGYCPDVEQCIEVLRGRGVVVWTVFQTLSQIARFQKPDLFKGAPLKQIFTNDDTETMEWIQTLGGKKTVLSKSLSRNEGDSRQTMHITGGSVSKGEGESVQEVSSDLIQLNEIRELPFDQQFVFLHGSKPIRCKKVRYFEHSDFAGKYDSNPLESKK